MDFLNGDARLENKKHTFADVFLIVVGKAGFGCHPLNGDVRLENKKHTLTRCVFVCGGEGGI